MYFFFNYKPYIAIIGDIKNSKKIKNRKSVQIKLNNVLNRINLKYESAISAKFMITLGDEFQGLLCDGKNVLDIVEEIQRELYPVEIRIGIGIGEITTDINSEILRMNKIDNLGGEAAKCVIWFTVQSIMVSILVTMKKQLFIRNLILH